MDVDWRTRALCRGKDTRTWYPGGAQPGAMEAAKSVCFGCPVRRVCLDEAMATAYADDFGVWGGTSKRQRKRMRLILGMASAQPVRIRFCVRCKEAFVGPVRMRHRCGEAMEMLPDE